MKESQKRMKSYLPFLACLFLLPTLAAQVIITPISSPESLVACGASGNYVVNVTNTDNSGYGNVIFTLLLPSGMEYVQGSLQGSALEHELSNPRAPQFRFPGLPGLSLLTIEFETLINCSFDNTTAVSYSLVAGGNTYTATEQPLANFFLPEIVITEVDNPVLNLAVNGVGQRTFTIIQSTPDAYLDTIFLLNSYDADMASLGADLGTLVGSGVRSDTIMITGSDLPGGDNEFNFGDTIRITEQIRLLGCAQANSRVSVFWRCGSDICQSTATNTLITQGTGSPDLRIRNTTGFADQVSANNPSLVGGGFCDTVHLSYDLENLGEEDAPGAGAVYDLTIGLGLNNNLFSLTEPFDLDIFPNWEIIAFVNGQPVDLGAYHFPNPNPLLGYNLSFTAQTSDPDGPGGLTDVDGDGFFDDLPVNARFDLEVYIVYDPFATDGCSYLSGYPNNGGAETVFRVGYHYLDQCTDVRNYWYSVNDPGINVVSLFTHRSVTYNVNLEESNLFPGQVTNLEIRPDGAWNSPCGATDSIVLELILPDGLAATGNAYGPGQFSGIVGQAGDTIRLASTERGTFTQPWGLSVTPDCGMAIVDTTVDVSFLYFCAPDCGPMRRIDCAEIPIDFLAQCDPCADGIDTYEFEVERRSFGWTNSTHTERVNPNTDPTINLKAAMNFDSVAFRLAGVYRGNGPFDSLFARISYLGINPSFADPNIPNFIALGNTMTYLSSDGTTHECIDAPVTFTFNPGIRQHEMIAELESFFAPGGCLEGINRQAGDSLVFELYTLVGENTPRRALPLPELRGELYLSNNGNLIRCNEYLDQFILEEVVPNSNLAYPIQEHYGCEEIYFNNNSITNPGHIYDGDQFPNEVRTLVDVSEVRLILEGNWQITPGSSDLLANGSFDENDAVSTTAPFVIVPLPDPIVSYDGTFTIFTYQNPGNWPNGDLAIGGSNPAHNIRFRARPGCQVPTGSPFIQRMETDMIRYLNAPLAFRDTITSTREITNKTYLGPEADLLLASPQTFIPNSDTVSWDIRITNTTSYGNEDKIVRNGWLAVEADSSVMIYAITEITDPNNPIVYPLQHYSNDRNYWITIDSLDGFSSRNFRIEGIYTECRRQELMIRYGYSCFGDPEPDPGVGYQLAGTTFSCPARELPLFIQPSPVSLVLETDNPPSPYPLCTEQVYSVQVSNLQLATAYSLDFSASLPFGARIIGGTSALEVPANSGNWRTLPDPQYLGNNLYYWNLNEISNGLTQLPGVNDAPANTYRIRFSTDTECGLNAGIRIGFAANGANSCGQMQERRAFSERILIEGIPDLTNNYGLRLFTPDEGLQACDSARIEARLINLGPLATTDIEYALLTLPAAYNYVPGSYSGNASLDDNTVFDDRRMLRFPLPAGVPPGDSISFTFQVEDLRKEFLSCTDQEMTISSVLKTKVACGLNPADSCDVLLILNSDTLQVAQQKDQFLLTETFNEARIIDNQFEEIRTHLRITNTDLRTSRSDTLGWAIYYDQDADGSVNPDTDPLLYQSDPLYWSIDSGESILDSLTYSVPYTQTCQLIAVLRNPNQSCFCEPFISLPLSPPILRNAGPNQAVCSADEVWIGGDNRSSSDLGFVWRSINGNADDLLTTDSAYVQFSRPNESEAPQRFLLELATTRIGTCITTDTMEVTVWAALRPEATVTSDYNGTPISCYGAADGEITANISLGTEPITYTLNGASQNQTVFTDLPIGIYTIEYTDGNGCMAQDSVQLDQPDSLSISLLAQPVICAGGNDGSIMASADGGTGGYSYNWSVMGQANSPSIANLSRGLYNVTLTDANACELVSDSVFVDEAPPIRFQISTDSTRCADSSDGSVRLDTLYGGFEPFQISWSNGQSGLQAENYSVGIHQLQIEDAAGCTIVDSFRIPGPLPIQIDSLILTDISCFNGQDGAIQLTASGGSGQLQYNWTPTATGNVLTDLNTGFYQVTISDFYNCTLRPAPYRLTQPDSLIVAFTAVQDVRCFGESNGSVIAAAQGGTPPYSYNWLHGNNQPRADNLIAGYYPIIITDVQNCTSTDSILITEPAPIQANIRTEGPGCAGNSGRIFFEPSGGTPPYRYEAGAGSYFSDLPFLIVEPDTYSTSTIDARGCRFDSTVVVPEPLRLEVQLVEDEFVINYGDSVKFEAIALNVRGDTLIRWTPANNFSCTDCLTPWVQPERSTNYQLEVRDSFNCHDAVLARIVVEYPERLFFPNAFSPNGDGQNDILYPFGAQEVERIESLQIFNRWGTLVYAQENFAPNDPGNGWDGNLDGEPLPSAVYVYRLVVRYTYGEIREYMGDVILVR